MTSLTPPTKLVPPRVDSAVRRTRVDLAVEAALAGPDVKAVFLGAPPGSGKSTWAAHFVRHRAPASVWLRLDEADADPPAFFAWLAIGAEQVGLIEPGALPSPSREHLVDLSAYARLWLRTFSSRLRCRTLVVMDDLHSVLASPRFAPVLPLLLDEGDTSCRFVLLSRSRLPPALARHRLNGTLAELDPALLSFTADEVGALLDTRNLPRQAAAALWERTKGWPAATVAFAGQAAPHRVSAVGSKADALPDALRDFIRAEVLAGVTGGQLEVLAALAALPYFRPSWSARLTGGEEKTDFLGDAAQRGWFVERFPGEDGSDVCRLHPLLAEVIELEANERLVPARIVEHLVRSAQLLQADGAREAAARLFLRAGAWSEAMAEIVALAPALLASARHLTLQQLASAVPEAQRSATLWLALAQAELLFDPARGRACAVMALERCRVAEPPAAGPPHTHETRIRALAVVFNSYFLEFSSTEPLSRWLLELREAGAFDRTLDPDLEAVLAVSVWSGLFLREPGHPDLGAWEQRVRTAIAAPGDPNVRLRGAMLLAKHYWYTGQYLKIPPLRPQAALHLNHPGLQPYARLTWYLFLQYDCWARADVDEGRRVTADALAFARACGIHLVDNHLRLHGACFALLERDETAAFELLAAVEAASSAARRMEVWHHFTCRSWFANCRGDTGPAIEYARVALDAAEAMGPSPTGMALAALAQAQLRSGDLAGAARSRERLMRLASTAENPLAQLHAALLEVELADRRGEAGEAALRSALSTVRAQRLLCFPGIDRESLRRLCARAFSADIETDVAKELVRKWGIAAAGPRVDAASWPWPVRILTLGGFSVSVDDATLQPHGKACGLLQAVIALGATDVAEGMLAQALWPDSEGDAAHHALEVSVHRLRKLIGKESIVVQGGRVSLDRQRCWVDVWALERAFAGLDDALRDGSPVEKIQSLVAEVQALYRGPFLGNDSQPWLLAARERVRSRYLHALDVATARFERAGKWPEVVALMVKGLDVDPFTEAFYRRVMLGYQKLGRPAEALSTWRRCQRTLSAGLGISPSPETEALARRLQQ